MPKRNNHISDLYRNRRMNEIKEQPKVQNFKNHISPIKPKCNYQIGFLRTARKNIGTFLEYLWELSRSIRLYKGDVAIIVGKEKYTSEPIKTVYVGNHNNDAFIFGRIYSEYEVIKKYEKINSLHTSKWLKRYRDSADLLITDVELLFCKMLPSKEFIQIPDWVVQKYEIPHTWESVLKSFRKNTKKTDLRKIRKYGFTYRFTTSDDECRSFYHKMHKPYIKKRFNAEADIESEWEILRQFRKGGLLQILRGEEVVSAAVLKMLYGKLVVFVVGVPDNIEGEMFKGVFSALYYFTIVHAYNNGCHEINFHGTRPLLNDGVFRYKRKWGTYVQDISFPRGDILLQPLRFNAPLISFFSHNHFITRDGKKLAGKILFGEHKVAKTDIEHCLKYHFTKGLDYLKIFSLLGFENGTKEWADTTHKAIRLHDLSHSPSSAEDFCRL